MGHFEAEGKPQFVLCFVLFSMPEGPKSYLPHLMNRGRGPILWGMSIAITLEVRTSIGSPANAGLWCRVLRGRLGSERAFE